MKLSSRERRERRRFRRLQRNARPIPYEQFVAVRKRMAEWLLMPLYEEWTAHPKGIAREGN